MIDKLAGRTESPRHNWIARIWLAAWLAVGGGLLFFWSASTVRPGLPAANAALMNTGARSSIPIEDIRVGQRVLTTLPAGNEDLQFGRTVDPATWKTVSLRAPKQDGSIADVVLLRPNEWFADNKVRIGEPMHIFVPECGIQGIATVRDVAPCPAISEGEGEVVTGTFRHRSAAVIDITVAGIQEPIGTTANHPFWSEDRKTFVRADSLQPGEHLRTFNGLTTVESVTRRARPQPVYNLEVAVNHTYHVAATGVLVHNGGPCKLHFKLDYGPESAYLIRMDPNFPGRPDPRYSIDTSTFTSGASKLDGGVENSRQFWKKWCEEFPESISAANYDRIYKDRVAPVIDPTWTRYFPEHSAQQYANTKLIHHHVEQGRYAVPVPKPTHMGQEAIWHPR